VQVQPQPEGQAAQQAPQPIQQRLPSVQFQQVQPVASTPYVLTVGSPPNTGGTVLVTQSGACQPVFSSGNLTMQMATPIAAVGTSSGSRKQVPVAVEVVSSSSPPLSQPCFQVVTTQSFAPPHVPNRVPTLPGVEHLDPLTAFNLLREGRCVLVDLRSDDRAAGLIEGALHIPAIGPGSFSVRLPELTREWANQELVILTCQYSAHRAPQCANWYRQQAPAAQRVAILSGGFRGWEATGLPVQALVDEKNTNAVDEIALHLGNAFLESLPVQTGMTQVMPVQMVVGPPVQMVSASGMVAQTLQAVAPFDEHVVPQPPPSTTCQGLRTVGQQQIITLPQPPAGSSQPHGIQHIVTSQPPALQVVTQAQPVYVTQPQTTTTTVVGKPRLIASQDAIRPAYGMVTEPETGRQVYVPPPCPNRVPTIAGIEHLDPLTVFSLLQEKKCLVIDLRGEDRAAGLIDGALHVPAIATVPFLTRVPELVRKWADQNLVVFTCQYSAHRAPQCANWYRAQASLAQGVGILSGGFRGWESVGLPVTQLGSIGDSQAADALALVIGNKFVQSAPVQEAESQAAKVSDIATS